MMNMVRIAGTAATIGLLAFGVSPSLPAAASQSDVLAKTKAVYAGLKTYADTGSVDYEFGPAKSPSREHHTFKTFYRAPREFLFDFVKQQNADRFVIWGDAEAFHTWWLSTGVQELYPKGQGAGAFAAAATPTSHAVMVIAPLLFAQAGLAGTLTEVVDIKAAGTETLNGHQCQKLVGVAKSVYAATGRETNIRPTTVWIDAETLLVRKVFEDSPQGTAASDLLRFTTTFEPLANPPVDDARFRFTPPVRR
jgi:outer membrane lipoprotein-sorting protein